MKIAVLTANLGSFDNLIGMMNQNIDADYHVFTDTNFPPITGLTPRLQYRIPKLFGWEMVPDYDIYIWLDGSMSLQYKDSVQWLLEQLGDADMAVFAHPWRWTIEEEVNHIEEKLKEGNKYITSRYQNGLHKEMFEIIKEDKSYLDNMLFASNVFVYRNNEKVQEMMKSWWYYQSRYFTCDQVAMPYVIDKSELDINIIADNVFKTPYVSLVSKHK